MTIKMVVFYCRQEKERVEMQKRQIKELGDFYKKIEQRKNEKPKESKRAGISTTSSTKSTGTTTQTVVEFKPSNGHTVKPTVKKQIHHSDENLTKLQQRSMQQFEYDASKKKGGGSAAIGGWSTNKHNFNQMKGQSGATPMVMKGPRGPVATPTSSSSMPHIPQSTPGYIPHTSSSQVFATPHNAMHGNLAGQIHPQWHGENTGVYWTNGANQNWQAANIEVGNGRGQPITFPDASWQANGPYLPVTTQPQQQMAQASNPPRTDSQVNTDNTKHTMLPPSR